MCQYARRRGGGGAFKVSVLFIVIFNYYYVKSKFFNGIMKFFTEFFA